MIQLNATVISIAGVEHDILFPTARQQKMTLRTIADWVIRPRLLKTTGVAEVFLQGGDRKQYQILVDPTALPEYGASLQEVEPAVRSRRSPKEDENHEMGDLGKCGH